jgi:hypothetical protein
MLSYHSKENIEQRYALKSPALRDITFTILLYYSICYAPKYSVCLDETNIYEPRKAKTIYNLEEGGGGYIFYV